MNSVNKNPFVRERQERIQEVFEWIKKKCQNNHPVQVSEISGVFGVKYGLTESTILSYLRALDATGKIVLTTYDVKLPTKENDAN